MLQHTVTRFKEVSLPFKPDMHTVYNKKLKILYKSNYNVILYMNHGYQVYLTNIWHESKVRFGRVGRFAKFDRFDRFSRVDRFERFDRVDRFDLFARFERFGRFDR